MRGHTERDGTGFVVSAAPASRANACADIAACEIDVPFHRGTGPALATWP